MIGRGLAADAEALATAGFLAAAAGGCVAAGVATFGAAGAAAEGGLVGSGVMMLTGGIDAALGKSKLVGRPVGTVVVGWLVGVVGVTAAIAGDGAAPAVPHAVA